jgi:hypothetical protein
MMNTFALVVGIVGTVIIGLIAAIVVKHLWAGTIDLSQLLSDSNKTSLSRFQFLIFTFIIGLSYLLLVIARLAHATTATELTGLPEVSNGVLGLIGISAGSYVAGKGIEKAAQTALGGPVGSPP